MLYEELNFLQENVLYIDTDSNIYIDDGTKKYQNRWFARRNDRWNVSQSNQSIGNFRVLLWLCFKTSVSAKPFIWKWDLQAVSFSCKSVIFIRMVSHLHSLWNRDTKELRNSLFVSTSPKSYSFKYGDNQQNSKTKKFALNHENASLLIMTVWPNRKETDERDNHHKRQQDNWKEQRNS